MPGELTQREANAAGVRGESVCLICMRVKQARGGRQSWTAPKCNETCPGYDMAPEPPARTPERAEP